MPLLLLAWCEGLFSGYLFMEYPSFIATTSFTQQVRLIKAVIENCKDIWLPSK